MFIAIGAGVLSSLGLLIYSYTQVDLNLTLSSRPVYLQIQEFLTAIGYFNRPLSTGLFIIIVAGLFLSYLGLLAAAFTQKLTPKLQLKLALLISMILLFAYPAFSYDVFNYIFDARILVEHGVNPYTHTALDFPDDTWTRFMRWTHRTYPYGPTWLPLTLPFYLLGLGKFTLTLLSFKILCYLSYLGGAWAITSLLREHNPKWMEVGLALYVFNPLILIEGLVSAHLDMVMAGIMLVGIGLVSRTKLVGWATLLVAAAIKYVSAATIPFVWLWRQNFITYKRFIAYSLLGSYGLTLVVISQREILPWYFLVPFSLTALLPQSRLARTTLLALTPAMLMRYAPFLYVGSYPDSVYLWRNIITGIVFLATFICLYISQKKYPILAHK